MRYSETSHELTIHHLSYTNKLWILCRQDKERDATDQGKVGYWRQNWYIWV